jgi:glycopeptide antibiotics resistance protein
LWTALAFYAGVGLALTLVPSNPFDELFKRPGVDAAVNLVMFVPPVVLLLVLVRRVPAWVPVVAVAILSASIEAAQHWVVQSRDASVVDWACNTAGAALGAVGAAALRRLEP